MRTDRIGDVVLSLPVFTSIARAFPKWRVTALTRDYTRGLFSGRGDVDDIISFDSGSSHIPWGVFFKLLKKIKDQEFDVAIVLYSNFSVALLLAMARIPVRIGPATKLAQLFLTYRITQRRSKGERHEADHNLDLLAPLNIPPVKQASIARPDNAKNIFIKQSGRPLVGIHPGCGGSSPNWPETYYSDLIQEISASGVDVAVTGADHEREMVERIVGRSGCKPQIYIGSDKIEELIGALALLDVFVGPSTGPLHIASALGVPVVGIYSPILVCLPERWGPRGKNDTAITPPGVPVCHRCVGDKCPHWDCMEKIGVKRVKGAILSRIKSPVNL